MGENQSSNQSIRRAILVEKRFSFLVSHHSRLHSGLFFLGLFHFVRFVFVHSSVFVCFVYIRFSCFPLSFWDLCFPRKEDSCFVHTIRTIRSNEVRVHWAFSQYSAQSLWYPCLRGPASGHGQGSGKVRIWKDKDAPTSLPRGSPKRTLGKNVAAPLIKQIKEF